MDKEKLVRDFIIEHYPAAGDKVGKDTDLVEAGILDSMGIIALVSHLEKIFNASFADEDITVENFGSIESVIHYLQSKGL